MLNGHKCNAVVVVVRDLQEVLWKAPAIWWRASALCMAHVTLSSLKLSAWGKGDTACVGRVKSAAWGIATRRCKTNI